MRRGSRHAGLSRLLAPLATGTACGARRRYRAEAVIGVHRLPEALLRDHQLDPRHLPHFGRDFWWGPPYAFIQGRLWHGGTGPWGSHDTMLPSEGALPVLHRGTVELVGEGNSESRLTGEGKLRPGIRGIAGARPDCIG